MKKTLSIDFKNSACKPYFSDKTTSFSVASDTEGATRSPTFLSGNGAIAEPVAAWFLHQQKCALNDFTRFFGENPHPAFPIHVTSLPGIF